MPSNSSSSNVDVVLNADMSLCTLLRDAKEKAKHICQHLTCLDKTRGAHDDLGWAAGAFKCI